MNLPHPSIGAAALQSLQGYAFPGNVRELKNLVERALIESGGDEIREEHLHFVRPAPNAAVAGRPGAADPRPAELPPSDPAGDEERRILEHVRLTGSINNTECRRLLDADMHHAWYVLHKLHAAGPLRQKRGRRWTRYRLA